MISNIITRALDGEPITAQEAERLAGNALASHQAVECAEAEYEELLASVKKSHARFQMLSSRCVSGADDQSGRHSSIGVPSSQIYHDEFLSTLTDLLAALSRDAMLAPEHVTQLEVTKSALRVLSQHGAAMFADDLYTAWNEAMETPENQI